MDPEEKNKLLEVMFHLANRTEKLAKDLREETFEKHGAGVFLMMLDAKLISEALTQLHEHLNLK